MIFVPYVQEAQVADLASLESALSQVSTYQVECVNWPGSFPYAPKMSFKMLHTGSHLVVKYEVTEDVVAAVVEDDMGEVWTDSCVEFFLQPTGEGMYYNLEATCIGKILLAHRSGRDNPVRASEAVLGSIARYPSLGAECFAEKKGPVSWSLILVIPASALFEEGLESFSGLKGRCNVYKCGDKLSKPHFVSFAPIATPKPDFHRPEYFTEIVFE